MANELSLWTHKNAILPAASTLVSVAESNPDTFSHRYCLPDVISFPVRLRKQGRDLVGLATGQYLPPGLPWYFHHPIHSLTERDSLEQLGHRCSPVCRERWDGAARVERADRKAPSVEPGSLRRVGAE